MLLVTLFALKFKLWQANLEHIMIEFTDVMNIVVNDEKITHTEHFRSKSLKII